MRLWSLHPKYLDVRGLTAVWREALLAQAVLRRRTRGYRRHPQLDRFRERRFPVRALAAYLRAIRDEAARRGYRFAAGRIARGGAVQRLTVTRGQLQFEWRHLMKKLRARDPQWLARLAPTRRPRPHPLFRIVRGGIAPWEKGAAPRQTRPRRTALLPGS